ncbi:MAG: ABC transporter substrate-binding protein [Eubacteriales bacterium]|nr:ABC transporter substrate-binding protein [Eubacteriales bacterium]
MKKGLCALLALSMILSLALPVAGLAEEAALKEAPMLAEKVAAGELPAVADRMPAAADIMVEPDVVAIGQYGGNITLQSNDNGRWSAWGYISEQSMFRFKQDGSGEVEPNVCKAFSANEDSTVWTITLREGMRWSDGEPFTADDVLFYYDHMSTPALNEDRTPVDSEAEGYYSAYTSKAYNCYQVQKDGKKYWAKMDKVSDTEFTVTFVAPKPSFAQDVAVDNKWMFMPKHFYINYVARKDGVADDPTFPLITEEEAIANANRDFGKVFESYSTMGKAIGYYHWDYAIIPQIRSFIAVKDNWNAIGETYTLVRNPYFWKTDAEGNQLPYLDSVSYKIINEQDQITLAASAGEFDIVGNPPEFSVVATALKDTHDIVTMLSASWSSDETIQLNQTCKDLDKRALFQDQRFRQALSICVDRNLLNETLRNGMCQPAQASVGEGRIGYDPEWSAKWTEYDVEKANALLDEITEPWDRAEGTYRTMKGTDKTLEIILTVNDASKYGDFVTLLQSAYKQVGVKLSDKIDEDARTTMLSNDVEASMETTSVSTPALRPDSIVPMRNVAFWHSAWGKWYEDGRSEANGGIAPTGDALKLVEAYDRMKAASGPDRDQVVAECVQEIYNLHKENIWIIGYLSPLPDRQIISKKLHNFTGGLMLVDEFRFTNLCRPEQWWLEQ